MEKETISGFCRHCGKHLEIPAELTEFSCLYCGTRMKAEDLQRQERVDCLEARAALEKAKKGLPGAVTGYLNAFRYLNAKAFPEHFKKYTEENREVLEALPPAAQVPGAPLEELADSLLSALETWSLKEKKSTRSQDSLLDDAKITICLLLIPALRSLGDPAGEAFCQVLHKKWLEKYPKKVFSLTNYETIMGGFQNRKLCFITTAVCQMAGKPDDCPELTAFRHFRDTYMKAHCPELIETYYEIAPAIVTVIDYTDSPERVYPEIWERYLSSCYEDLRNQNWESCQKTYTEMVQALSRRYLWGMEKSWVQ